MADGRSTHTITTPTSHITETGPCPPPPRKETGTEATPPGPPKDLEGVATDAARVAERVARDDREVRSLARRGADEPVAARRARVRGRGRGRDDDDEGRAVDVVPVWMTCRIRIGRLNHEAVTIV